MKMVMLYGELVPEYYHLFQFIDMILIIVWLLTVISNELVM